MEKDFPAQLIFYKNFALLPADVGKRGSLIVGIIDGLR